MDMLKRILFSVSILIQAGNVNASVPPESCTEGLGLGPDLRLTMQGSQLHAVLRIDGSNALDAQPCKPHSFLWSLVDGPSGVSFSNPGMSLTVASFSGLGTFRIQLEVEFDQGQWIDELDVEVISSSLLYVDHGHPSADDANSGRLESAPLKTIAKANELVQPGDRVIVKSGIYPEAIQPSTSGTALEPITYSGVGYPQLGGADACLKVTNLSFVIVEGFFCNAGLGKLNYWALLHGAEHATIRDNQFIGLPFNHGILIASHTNEGGERFSRFNQFIGNVMIASSAGSLLETIRISKGSDANLFESNFILDGGHNCLLVQSSRNILRDNWISNSATTREYRAISFSSEDAIEYNVLDGNRVFNNGGSHLSTISKALQHWAARSIIRKNMFYSNDGAGMGHTRPGNSIEGTGYATDLRSNRLVHNVFFRNGEDPAIWTREGFLIWIGGYGANSGGDVLMNNIFHRNDAASSVQIRIEMFGSSGFNGLVLANNAIRNESPGEVVLDIAGPGGLFGPNTLDFYQAAHPQSVFGNVELDPLFVDPDGGVPDFSLQGTSPMIDQGSFLTRVLLDGSGTTTTSTRWVPVEDSGYFTDGHGVTAGDWVQFENSGGKRTRILALDYLNHFLLLDREVLIQDGEGVSLPYSGSRPDIGAIEFNGE